MRSYLTATALAWVAILGVFLLFGRLSLSVPVPRWLRGDHLKAAAFVFSALAAYGWSLLAAVVVVLLLRIRYLR